MFFFIMKNILWRQLAPSCGLLFSDFILVETFLDLNYKE